MAKKKNKGSEPNYKVIIEKNLPMRTRDGVNLYADIYRPDAEGKFPVLVVRTPYDKGREMALTEKEYFSPRGYVVVVQDTRGRFSSEGEFYPFIHEAQDSYDCIEWAAGLPWSDGNVGTVGQSYMALVQYFAGSQRPPHLKAMCPVSAPATYFEDCIYRRGVFELGWMLAYTIFLARNYLGRKGLYGEQGAILDKYLSHPEVLISPCKREEYRHLPLRDWGERLKDGAPYLADFLRHPVDGPYWHATDLRRQFHNFDVPTLHVGSWYDVFQYDTLSMFNGLREKALTPEARNSQKLFMGPWAHLMPYAIPTSKGTGDIDFGSDAVVELHAIQLRWFDQLLKGLDNGMLSEPPIRLFVMGENRWRDENEWPLARTRYTSLYLHGGGNSGSLHGDGTLSFSSPGEELPDRFIYDPNDPVPTRGGTVLGLASGVFDQRQIEERKDVLVYTGDPLASDLELTGPISLKLFAASSAPDTDFTAKLVDAHPDGYAQNVAEGVIRARFRESLLYPTLIIPGKVYEYTIDLWATSHVFKPGHRMRLEVSSSNFPRYDRNPNTGHEFGVDRKPRTAQQTVFHDIRCPSHLILPVIPG